LYSVLAAGANAQGAYGNIGLASLIQGYINNGLKLICGWANMGAWGFAVAFNSGLAVACSFLGWKQHRDWFNGITRRRLALVAKQCSHIMR